MTAGRQGETRRKRSDIIKVSHYRGFKLYPYKKSEEGFYESVLEKTFDQIEVMLNRWSRINVVRFDVFFDRSQQGIDQQKVVAELLRTLKRDMAAWKKNGVNRGLDEMAYLYVREETADRGVHFHCFIATKNFTRKKRVVDAEGAYLGVFGKIVDAWGKVTRKTGATGSINFGTKQQPSGRRVNHIYQVDRAKLKEQEKLMRGLSYLAKVKTKETLPKSKQLAPSSRLKAEGEREFRLVRE